MGKKKRTIMNLALFVFLILLTFYVVFKDQDIAQILNLLLNVKKEYILIAVLCMCIYVVCEGINIGRTLKNLNEKSTFFKNIKYAIIGFFFSGITPAASGGQPMQVYYMYKDKVSVGNSTLALLINLTSMQIVTISLALISVVFNYNYLNTAMKWFFVLGITLNLSALTLLLLSLFSKKIFAKMIDIIVKIMKKLKLKNLEEKEKKLREEVKKYQEGSDFIKNHKILMIKTLITTYIQFIALYSVSYWVYKSFGLNKYSIIQLASIQSMLYATVSGIPSPGAVGVSEGGFIEIFSKLLPENMISSMMLLNRGINFYFLIIFGSIITAFVTFRIRKLKKTEK